MYLTKHDSIRYTIQKNQKSIHETEKSKIDSQYDSQFDRFDNYGLGLIIFSFAICHFYCWTNFLGLVNFVLDFRSITFLWPLKGSMILLKGIKCNFIEPNC